jgi:hypothetical protein
MEGIGQGVVMPSVVFLRPPQVGPELCWQAECLTAENEEKIFCMQNKEEVVGGLFFVLV